MSGWDILITTPDDGRHVFLLPEGMDPVADEALSEAKAAVDCPEDWLNQPGWDVSIASSPVHPSTLEGSTEHDWRDGTFRPANAASQAG